MTETNLPEAFVKRVSNDPFLGTALLDALNAEQPISIRMNSLKGEPVLTNLEAIPWSKNGFYLAERPSFTLDPHFHGGRYYPQEAGSQFIDSILRNIELPLHPIILDLCAAPGGKSTLIADYLNGRGLLIANEVIQARSKILKENLTKWGTKNTLVSNNDPSDFEALKNLFDCILIDAPCSGEGMFRKDLGARNEWSEESVNMCAARQKRIVMDVWDSLKPGGFLIYSTCTFNEQENEENASWILQQVDAQIVSLQIPSAKKGRNGIGHYALPSELKTEGFFFVVIQKNGEERIQKNKSKKKSTLTRIKPESWVSEWTSITDSEFIQWNNYLFAIPVGQSELFEQLHSNLRIIKMGTELGEISRKGLIPHEALALDHSLLSSEIPDISLTKDQALHYLKGETFHLEGTQGFNTVSFEGTKLGWIKHLGNRFNNLYPKEWRIRMRID
ncbi:methyltransferase RsmF C-terminal domain-like protein [Fluviicola taffensis]|uniref:Fmu (Sun) domain protein n=1 Tax=Fluviicola taffensis (strain DSM 16823 / NCIMB 13979 / RW262) TaxID=755732 RepID=F2IFQ5_FLUTR|nr:Fmu (Sun) domain-containing protein [Fluviicola taffensis]AEA42513.1 Fmu (Sun) domain protein [Fluviicola taffensis DSM 16823]